MGFFSDVWQGAKDLGQGVVDVHEDFLTLGQGWEAPADVVTGGAISQKEAAKKARAEQMAALTAAERLQQEGIDTARSDINALFPQSMDAARGGYQGALDIFGQSVPAQTDVFTQGNLGAQQAILAGMPQIQNALLGGQIDYSAFQPFQVQQPDMSFMQQTLPERALTPFEQQQQADQNAVDLAKRVGTGLTGLLSGMSQRSQGVPQAFVSIQDALRGI